MTGDIISGIVRDIFAHRFTLQTDNGLELADLTPRGEEQIELRSGDAISIQGERKPSEIKVRLLERGGVIVTIEPAPKHPKEHGPDREADPAVARQAALQAGFTILAEPRRKPKHFEILGRSDNGTRELHITLDGVIRKEKPADPADGKWRTGNTTSRT